MLDFSTAACILCIKRCDIKAVVVRQATLVQTTERKYNPDPGLYKRSLSDRKFPIIHKIQAAVPKSIYQVVYHAYDTYCTDFGEVRHL